MRTTINYERRNVYTDRPVFFPCTNAVYIGHYYRVPSVEYPQYGSFFFLFLFLFVIMNNTCNAHMPNATRRDTAAGCIYSRAHGTNNSFHRSRFAVYTYARMRWTRREQMWIINLLLTIRLVAVVWFVNRKHFVTAIVRVVRLFDIGTSIYEYVWYTWPGGGGKQYKPWDKYTVWNNKYDGPNSNSHTESTVFCLTERITYTVMIIYVQQKPPNASYGHWPLPFDPYTSHLLFVILGENGRLKFF